MSILSDRLDVKRMIFNEANLLTLSNIMMEPYQIKLIQHLQNINSFEPNKRQSLSLREAVRELSKKIEISKDRNLASRFDNFLLKILQQENSIRMEQPSSLREKDEPETGAVNPFELRLGKKKINKNVYSFKF